MEIQKKQIACGYRKKDLSSIIFTDNPIAFTFKMTVPFALQLHVTEKCNLRCIHCYNNSWEKELSFSDFKRIVLQFKEILELTRAVGTVYITGGEPLLWPHLYNGIHYLVKNKLMPRLLTNGTLIDSETAKKLRKAGLRLAQVSLDGLKDTHEFIRGPGTFEKVINGIKNLISENVEVTVMVTIMRKNLKDVDGILKLVESLGVKRISFGRFVPIGTGSTLAEEALTPEEVYLLFKSLSHKKTKVKIIKRDPLWNVINTPKLAFSGCSAGQFLLDVLVDGTVYPCRSLPIPVGNVFESNLTDIWLFAPTLEKIRNRKNLECNSCPYIHLCGGCRGIAYATTHNIFSRDPQCFIDLINNIERYKEKHKF